MSAQLETPGKVDVGIIKDSSNSSCVSKEKQAITKMQETCIPGYPMSGWF